MNAIIKILPRKARVFLLSYIQCRLKKFEIAYYKKHLLAKMEISTVN